MIIGAATEVQRNSGHPPHDRERQLRQHQQRRGWLEANAHLGPQYRQVVRAWPGSGGPPD